ncbi:MAG TPA: DUF192 domain-containing protein [Dongiaceae bacterium]|jgi:hypothetical protein|nr:DUF192 domain-containing protein [Dongiaceae bacterium]
MRRWIYLVGMMWLSQMSAVWALETVTLTVSGASGRHTFQAELARTFQEREEGLMFRRNLAPDAGMLFLFPAEQSVAFWMKNTYLPLDLLFIGADGQVRQIAKNAHPLDETPIPSLGPVQYVFEVNAGTTDRLGIQPGDRVTF